MFSNKHKTEIIHPQKIFLMRNVARIFQAGDYDTILEMVGTRDLKIIGWKQRGKILCLFIIAPKNVAVQNQDNCNVFCGYKINKSKIYVNKVQKVEEKS